MGNFKRRITGLLGSKGQQGFTLLELMIAIAILGVLMAIVVPRVTGTKGASLESQMASDGYSTQTAVDNFNNRSIKENQWPEQELGTKYAYSTVTGSTQLAPGDQIVLMSNGEPVVIDPDHFSEVNWNAVATVWQQDGAVYSATFMPDFVIKMPGSVDLQNDEGVSDASGSMLHEVLWLLKKNQVGQQDEGRTVQVFRLTEYDSTTDTITYEQIF